MHINLPENIVIKPILDSLKLEKIDDEIYFSKQYSNYISNSRLGLLKNKGAKAFFEGLKSGGYNQSFDFGSNLHALYLQNDLFELIDTVYKPTAKAGILADYLYKDNGLVPTDEEIKTGSSKCNYYKDKFTQKRLDEFKKKAQPYWRDRYLYEQAHPIITKQRIYTDEKSVGILKGCLESLHKNTEFERLVYPESCICTANEQAILLDVEVSIGGYEPKIYSLKSKLDNFVIYKDRIIVNDLKTTSRPVGEFDPTYYSYQREIAMYSWLLNMCAKKFFDVKNPTVEGNFLVVSTIPEYNTRIYPMTTKLFHLGYNEFKYLLKTAAYLNIVKGYEFQ